MDFFFSREIMQLLQGKAGLMMRYSYWPSTLMKWFTSVVSKFAKSATLKYNKNNLRLLNSNSVDQNQTGQNIGSYT